MDTDTQHRRHRTPGSLAALAVTAVAGAGLTWLFCQGYLWKAQDPHRGIRRLFGEPSSLIAVTAIEFIILVAFTIRAALNPSELARLGWAIGLLFLFNLVLTVALFGIPAY